jgi:hypothetical protein
MVGLLCRFAYWDLEHELHPEFGNHVDFANARMSFDQIRKFSHTDSNVEYPSLRDPGNIFLPLLILKSRIPGKDG